MVEEKKQETVEESIIKYISELNAEDLFKVYNATRDEIMKRLR